MLLNGGVAGGVCACVCRPGGLAGLLFALLLERNKKFSAQPGSGGSGGV